MNDIIRTRFAPSPTGPLHLGSARTALFNYLFAKSHKGQFILRIEDTDRERSRKEYEEDIINGLSWLGLKWDEEPQRQSERRKIYQNYINKLVTSGRAYKCFCTPEELEAERKAKEARHEAPKYSGRCRNLTLQEIAEKEKQGRKAALRFKIDPKIYGDKITFTDLIHGKMEFDPNLLGDFIIVKPDGDPIFLLSNIIDDAEMKITHVIRGDDHLSNTPKQLLLAEALDIVPPEYGHLPLILNQDRSKLSKRKNPTSVTRDFRDEGYLPLAMINFLALLGWAPKEEEQKLYTVNELVTEFDLKDVGKSPAIFDQQKLDFLNGYVIRKLPLSDLVEQSLPFLTASGIIKEENKKPEKLSQAISLVQERMKKLSEAPELIRFLFEKPTFNAELLIPEKGNKETTLKALELSLTLLKEENDFSRDSIEPVLRALSTKENIPAGQVLWPIRVALSGKTASPGAFELIEYFGKEETLRRIKTAMEMLQ